MNENEKAAHEAAVILERLEGLGKSILASYDDVSRVRCPVCGYPNFEIHHVRHHLVFECQTPVHHDCDDGGPFCVAPCGFRYIVDPTQLSNLPVLNTEPKKFSAPKRPRKRRSHDEDSR